MIFLHTEQVFLFFNWNKFLIVLCTFGRGDQTSSQLHKTAIDYDYFQFMKDDYDYTFIFAHGIMIKLQIIHFLNSRL